MLLAIINKQQKNKCMRYQAEMKCAEFFKDCKKKKLKGVDLCLSRIFFKVNVYHTKNIKNFIIESLLLLPVFFMSIFSEIANFAPSLHTPPIEMKKKL